MTYAATYDPVRDVITPDPGSDPRPFSMEAFKPRLHVRIRRKSPCRGCGEYVRPGEPCSTCWKDVQEVRTARLCPRCLREMEGSA
jgi:hypothetical protein